MTALDPWLKAVGRVLLSFMYLRSGIGKITGYASTAQYMESKGLPGELLPLVILVEILAPIAIIVGWQTRWAAYALAGFTILAALFFHWVPGDRMQMINFAKNFAIAGGFLVLAAAGPGAFALENRKS